MRHFLATLALASTLALSLAATTALSALAPAISVSPAAGSQNETFTFSGSGFDQGIILAVAFHGPAGEEYSAYKSGQPITVTADSSGDFGLSVVPAEAFAGSEAGTWRATFCTATNSPDCWSGTFDISVD